MQYIHEDIHLIVFVSRVVKFLQLLETAKKFNGQQIVVTKMCFCHYMKNLLEFSRH